MPTQNKISPRQLISTSLSALILLLVGAMQNNALAEETNPTAHWLFSNQFVVLDDRAWINNIETKLYGDLDYDGFYSTLSLTIDADTRYSSYRVYTAIDIIGVDNTQSRRLHTTSEFYLYGQSLNDEYFVDIDLIQNFDPDEYDLVIALIDANNDEVIDQVNAEDFSSIGALALESEDNEDVYVPVVEQTEVSTELSIEGSVRVVEYAGSSGYFMLLIGLLGLGLRARAK